MIERRALLCGLAACGVAAPGWGQGLLRPPPKPAIRPARLIRQSGLEAGVSYVVLAADGSLLEGRGADEPVAPASTLKVLTTLYALDQLGADRRFATRVLRFGDQLILAGGGDPTLDTDDLARLADLVVASGASAPAGFSVWGGALPRIEEISPPQEDYLAYNPAVSGMMLNFNRVHLGWQAGGAGLRLEARAEAHAPRAYTIRAMLQSGGQLFDWDEQNGTELWRINRAGVARPGSRWLPVRRPELYAGDVFQTLCRARGLVLPAPRVIESLPTGVAEVARVESAPLRDMLKDMMAYSTNLTAEVVGLHSSGKGNLPDSARQMQLWAQERGIEGLELFDHSGMSAQTRVTARAMGRVIATLGAEVGLRDLMAEVELLDAEGVAAPLTLAAKTGTLNFVSNLAGYGARAGRDGVIFATYINDMDRRAASEGQELPAGVVGWTTRAKLLQQRLVHAWIEHYG